MSGFSDDWLDLREPYDHRSRSPATEQFVLSSLPPGGPTRIIDLGGGTGSNLRHLALRIAGPQSWIILDHDRALLEAAMPRIAAFAETQAWACVVEASRLTIDRPEGAIVVDLREADISFEDELKAAVEGADLVTATALLDLASALWVESLAAIARASSTRLLMSLSVDGRILWDPMDPVDFKAAAAFERHQRRLKSFGPALGPDAPLVVEAALRDAGFAVAAHRSDWVLGADDRAMQRALLEGYLTAACEEAPTEADAFALWHERRVALIDVGRSTLVVGHVDLGAVPESRVGP